MTTEQELREALRTAVGHIEHMAAWIAARPAGYSFEGLGEDMPTIYAAAAMVPKIPRVLVQGAECPHSPDGRHQVDTSMESGPNNCFHCDKSMAPPPRGTGGFDIDGNIILSNTERVSSGTVWMHHFLVDEGKRHGWLPTGIETNSGRLVQVKRPHV